ncbi:hypothetical protein [Paenibacillus sp. L3-i20]|uniref:hypothetical protein n=1 Tax=Paenibacillus sp. L3-i20 TaxID=2905833 RepID=UPI001EDECC1C|nr:hypothetical protein [Paenibacillus sp. L3-i20]GKU80293.1 hypothetical protein L3i20_v246900 [Paenibacillus sp. L3-i20]
MWLLTAITSALLFGLASLTSPLTNLNIVIVVAMSTWWYNKPLSVMQAIGILLLMLAGLIFIRL